MSAITATSVARVAKVDEEEGTINQAIGGHLKFHLTKHQQTLQRPAPYTRDDSSGKMKRIE